MRKVRPLDWALDQRTGQSTSNLVLIVIARRGNHFRICYMSQARIAAEVECSIETVGRALKRLIALGYIYEDRDAGKKYRTKTYTFGCDNPLSPHYVTADPSKRQHQSRQNDGQNPNESKPESPTSSDGNVDRLLISPPMRNSNVNRRRKATSIGELSSFSLAHFRNGEKL